MTFFVVNKKLGTRTSSGIYNKRELIWTWLFIGTHIKFQLILGGLKLPLPVYTPDYHGCIGARGAWAPIRRPTLLKPPKWNDTLYRGLWRVGKLSPCESPWALILKNLVVMLCIARRGLNSKCVVPPPLIAAKNEFNFASIGLLSFAKVQVGSILADKSTLHKTQVTLNSKFQNSWGFKSIYRKFHINIFVNTNSSRVCIDFNNEKSAVTNKSFEIVKRMFWNVWKHTLPSIMFIKVNLQWYISLHCTFNKWQQNKHEFFDSSSWQLMKYHWSVKTFMKMFSQVFYILVCCVLLLLHSGMLRVSDSYPPHVLIIMLSIRYAWSKHCSMFWQHDF